MPRLFHATHNPKLVQLLPDNPTPGSDVNSVLGTFFSTCPFDAVGSYCGFHPQTSIYTGRVFYCDFDDEAFKLHVVSGYDSLFYAPTTKGNHPKPEEFLAWRQQLEAEGYRGILFDLGEDWSYYVLFDLSELEFQTIDISHTDLESVLLPVCSNPHIYV